MSTKMKDTKERLSHITISLHWLVAVFMIGLMGVGFYMAENKVYSLYSIHKSLGAIIFAFVIIRVIWRLKNGFPKPVAAHKHYEEILGKITHWVLLIGTILFPLSGLVNSYLGGRGIVIFGANLISPNMIDGKAVAINKALAGTAMGLHKLLLPIMIIFILLHIAGALKHHIIDKNDTLRRMLGMKAK